MSDDEIIKRFDKAQREAANKAIEAAAVLAGLMGRPDIAEQIMKLQLEVKA